MTHPNEDRTDSNWDELARMLGLPPEPRSAPSSEPEAEQPDDLPMAELVEDDELDAEEVETIDAEEVQYDNEDALDDLDDLEEEAELPPPPPRKVRPVEPVLTVPREPLPWPSDDLDDELLNARASFEAPDANELTESSESEMEEDDSDIEVEEGAAAEAPGTPGEGGKKRRRRRRRRGKKGAAATEVVEGEAAPVTAPVKTAAPRTPAPAAPLPSVVHVFRAPTEEAEIEEPSEIEPEDEVLYEGGQDDTEEDEALDILENWNVPTWQELVASLYRPER